MGQQIISDNWSLQIISEMFAHGLSDEENNRIDIDSKNKKFSYSEIPGSIISIEALFDLITDIILRDQILVDRDFISAWKTYDTPVNKVAESGVIRDYPFRVENKKLIEPREEFVRRLCITDDLKNAHQENVEGLKKQGQSPHRYLSQTLWGGAGMLARSFVYEVGYTPHPVRKRFFIDTGLLLSNDSVVNRINNFVSEKRAYVAKSLNSNSELYSLAITAPPLPVLVIRESNSISDLMTVALQIRDEYQELRDWLGSYQQAMSDGNYRDIAKYHKIINSISLYIESRMGKQDPNAPTFTIGIDILKVAIKGRPLNTLQNQFGVRSMINNLIFERSGNTELKRFLGFFDHKNSKLGMQVLEHFSR